MTFLVVFFCLQPEEVRQEEDEWKTMRCTWENSPVRLKAVEPKHVDRWNPKRDIWNNTETSPICNSPIVVGRPWWLFLTFLAIPKSHGGKRIPPNGSHWKNKNEPTASVAFFREAGKLCGPIWPALDLKLDVATVAALDTSDDSKG